VLEATITPVNPNCDKLLPVVAINSKSSFI
jgi:hypothetical protein